MKWFRCRRCKGRWGSLGKWDDEHCPYCGSDDIVHLVEIKK